MGRSPCCDKLGLKKGPWTPEEDQKLLAYIEEHGHGNWRALPAKAGLQRCGKSCRLRWTNYLRPDIKRGKFSLQEEQTIIQLHALLGNRWSAIATHLPKRTDNEIKNYWNTHLKKRLTKMGIDPVTHKPKNDALLPNGDGSQQTKNAANLSHMAQWESARLEAEARLVRQSKLRSNSDLMPNHRHHHSSNGGGGTGSSSITSTISATTRCLDVLKAWHSVWPGTSTSTTTTTPEGIGVADVVQGSNTNAFDPQGGGGGGGLRVGSPTSTLSFSENGPRVLAGSGAVIEFIGHHNHHHDNHLVDQQGQIKEEGEQEWRRGLDHQNHNRKVESSLSFGEMAVSNIIEAANNNDEDPDEDDEHEHDESFMEGFTELLLSNANTSTTTNNTSAVERRLGVEEEDEGRPEAETEDRHHNHGTSSGGSDYYEDHKNYWNSILNLVNSSPCDSPMF